MLREFSDRLPADPRRDRRHALIVGTLCWAVGLAIVAGFALQLAAWL